MAVMKLLELLNHMPTTDDKAAMLRRDAVEYPQIGEMDAFDFLRSALAQVDCPGCVQHNVQSTGCRYCLGTGKVDYHLVSHPMNVYNEAKIRNMGRISEPIR